jgi:hypothetical protein
LFTPEGRIIGQLHGGYAACGNDDLDSYGRFYSSWSGGGSAGNSLATWLDPVGGGTNLVLDGTDQYGFTLDVEPLELDVCAGDPADYMISLAAQGGFSDPVTLASSLGGGFSVNPVTPPGSSVLAVDSNVSAGDYPHTVSGSGGGIDREQPLMLSVFDGAPGAATLTAPADGASDVLTAPTFTWTPGAQSATYDIGVFTNPGSPLGSMVAYALGLTEATWTSDTALDPLTTYYWIVRSKNPCGGATLSAMYSFTTREVPPVLLVDDDDNAPDVRATYTAALSANGLDYDLWDTGNSDNEPDAATMATYDMVLWFTGDEFGGAAGPGGNSEAELATYLDSFNGCLWLSSQDYLWDRGGGGSDVPTAFMTDYLGMANGESDVSQTSVTGQIGPFVGTYSLSFPYSNWSDILNPNANGNVLFVGNQGNAALYSLGSGWATTWWGFGLEALPSTQQTDFTGAVFNACNQFTLFGIDLFGGQ